MYKTVFIRSKHDMPKEDGIYFVNLKTDKPELIGLNVMRFIPSKDVGVWMETVDWYLQPLPATEGIRKDKIIKILNNLIPMAEDAIKSYRASGCHQEFIKDDESEVAEAKGFAVELIKNIIHQKQTADEFLMTKYRDDKWEKNFDNIRDAMEEYANQKHPVNDILGFAE